MWEYAARAGETAAFPNGGNLYSGDEYDCGGSLLLDNGELLDDIAWYCGNGVSRTHAVAGLEPNAWGLYDMSGNMWEWCHDRYGAYEGDATDPAGLSSGSYRVFRGGDWYDGASFARVSYRAYYYPWHAYINLGFRLLRSSP